MHFETPGDGFSSCMLQPRKVLLTSRSRRLVLLLKATMGGDGNICLQRLACARLSDSIVRKYFKKIRRASDLGKGARAVAARKMSLPSPRAVFAMNDFS